MTDYHLLFLLLIAHTLADFYWQPDRWVKAKNALKIHSPQLYWHALLHGLLAFAAVSSWLLLTGSHQSSNLFLWQLLLGVPITIAVSHLLIDLIKTYQTNSIRAFVLDQLAHLGIILLLWCAITAQWPLFSLLIKPEPYIVLIATLIILKPGSILIAMILSKAEVTVHDIEQTNVTANENEQSKLQVSGKWIGMTERILMLGFILIDQFAAVGFIIAAKSILRFGDLRKQQDRALTEYVLLGSLLSVALTFLVAIAAKAVLAAL